MTRLSLYLLAGCKQTGVKPGVFRETFNHASNDVAHFFAMHMAKGLQQMQKTLPNMDCIIEVHDARIPFSGRNPRFKETMTMIRPHILVLNKMDLADLTKSKAVEEKLINEYDIKKVLHTTCKNSAKTGIKDQLLSAVMEQINSSTRYNRAESEDYNLLIIGIPNVGKSSIINTLRQLHLHKDGKATPVGARPGVTRSVMERIKICEKPKVYVYDTPGIMLPCIPDMDVGLKLALCAMLSDHQVGVVTVADYMLFWLNKHSLFSYVQHYNLPEPVDDIYYFLAYVAKQQNLVLKRKSPSGGLVYRPNFDQAAAVVLRDFRDGRLGKVNLDIDLLSQETSYHSMNSAD